MKTRETVSKKASKTLLFLTLTLWLFQYGPVLACENDHCKHESKGEVTSSAQFTLETNGQKISGITNIDGTENMLGISLFDNDEPSRKVKKAGKNATKGVLKIERSLEKAELGKEFFSDWYQSSKKEPKQSSKKDFTLSIQDTHTQDMLKIKVSGAQILRYKNADKKMENIELGYDSLEAKQGQSEK